jgi:type IV fimbrial biogenesis protein FimT
MSRITVPTRAPGAASRSGDSERGLTLVELLVTLTIAAILASAAVPSFTFALSSYRISGQVNGWIGDLQYARAEAIKRGQTVTLCASSNGTSCTTATSNWQSGWIVFADANGNATVDAGESVLRSQALLAGSNTLTADNSVRAVTFNRDGFAIGLPAGNVTLRLHDATNDAGLTRCVALTTVGRTSVQRAGTGNCA